jgi:hypothetical protein
VKFDGDVVWDTGAPSIATGLMLDAASFTTDPKKKRIDPGKDRAFTLEFENDAASGPYTVVLNFGGGSGCEVVLDVTTEPPASGALCKDLKPIENLVLQYTGATPLMKVEWYRTSVDINNPNAADRIGTIMGSTLETMNNTFSFGNFATANSTNDVDFVLVDSFGLKQRSRFHLSCSDADMNDPTDCNNLVGDGKDNSVAGGNQWLLRDLQGKGLKMCNYPTP